MTILSNARAVKETKKNRQLKLSVLKKEEENVIEVMKPDLLKKQF